MLSSRDNIFAVLSILFFMVVGVACAQDPKSKPKSEKEPEADTTIIKPSYIPTGVRVGTDLISIVRSPIDDTFEGWEVNADVDFYRYFLAVDYGYWERNWVHDEKDDAGEPTGQQTKYSNNGNYWRVGADVNFLTKDPDRNMFFLGLRYARSSFSEQMEVITDDPHFDPPTSPLILTNTNIPASWVELTTGLRVKIWRVIWLGYTARLKFGLNMADTPQMKPSDVPGYGRADKESYWGFNYQIFFRIPTRKMPPLPTAKKPKKPSSK